MRLALCFLPALLTCAPSLAFDDLPYRPLGLDECDGQHAALQVGERCLTVSGRVLYTFDASISDGRLPKVESNTFFASVSQSDYGRARGVIGIQATEGWRDTWVPHEGNWDLTWGNETQVTDAYVSIGDKFTLTAGKRDPRWGSLLASPDPSLFWADGFSDHHLGSAVFDHALDRWSAASLGGGHVLQFEANVTPGLTLSAGLERLEGKGLMVARIDYSQTDSSAYLVGYQSGVLEENIADQGVAGGVSWADGDTRIIGTGWGRSQGIGVTSFQMSGLIEHTFDRIALVARADFAKQIRKGSACIGCGPDGAIASEYIAGGAEASYQVSPAVKLMVGAEVASMRDSWYAWDQQFFAGGVGFHLAENLALSVKATTLNEVHDWGSFLTHYVDGKAVWSPGGGVKVTAQGRAYQNGAWLYRLAAEKRF